MWFPYLLMFLIVGAISYTILYFVIKWAVRDAIVEARRITDTTDNEDEDDGTTIAQVICTACDKKHDMDYPRCPHCGEIAQ